MWVTARIVSDTANLLHTIIDSINEVSERIGAVRSDTQQIEIGGRNGGNRAIGHCGNRQLCRVCEMARELQSLISRSSITEKN